MQGKARFSYSYAGVIYLLSIVGLTLVFFVYGVGAMFRQRAEIVGLSTAEVRLSGQLLVLEVERGLWELAEACLREPILARLRPRAEWMTSARGLSQLRTAFDDAGSRHPLARYFFVKQGYAARVALPRHPGATAPSSADANRHRDDSADRRTLAHLLQTQTWSVRSWQPGQVRVESVTEGPRRYQVFATLLPATNIWIGFAADLDWIEHTYLPQSREDLGKKLERQDSFNVLLRPRADAKPKTTTASDDAAERDTVRVPFKTVLPFWELNIPKASVEARRTKIRSEMVFLVESTLMLLGVLAFGIFLLIRVFREQQQYRIRGEFVSAVSHELKTPLTLIRLYGETLIRGRRFTGKERRTYYRVIVRESDRLADLLDKVLDYSRVERGQKQYQLRQGNLASAVIPAVHSYKQYLKELGFKVQIEMARNLPRVKFDREAVHRAVLNLVDNARKYSGTSKLVEIRLFVEARKVIFEVSDHGIGMPAEVHGKIFKQFYRAQNNSGRGGYGLGLFLVKHAMDAHGGSVEVQSQSGVGSRFRLIFPVIETGASHRELAGQRFLTAEQA